MIVDKLARLIISDLLRQAASQLSLSDEKSKYIRNAIDLVDYPDTRIIKITSNYNKYLKRQQDEEPDETREKVEELEKRIRDLEQFSSLKDSLIESYKIQLLEVKG